jgi:2-dehydropantoate 2-reductase
MKSEKSKIRIGILGIGAVGGYFGGLLAHKYFNSETIDIIFIARQKTADIIRKNGLKLITLQKEYTIHPTIVDYNPDTIGELDYLICCTKSYDLEESLLAIQKCITEKTHILPLLNGVDSNERIKAILPHVKIIDGCVYLVSRILEPGIVWEAGNIHQLYFGSKTISKEKLKELETIILDAEIEGTLSENIEQTIWGKFIYVSSIASLTSALNSSIGEILTSEKEKVRLLNLIKELKLISDKLNINLPENFSEITLEKIKKLPFESSSSMHLDFKKGGKTECLPLTEHVVNMGLKLGIPTPYYTEILNEIKNNSHY